MSFVSRKLMLGNTSNQYAWVYSSYPKNPSDRLGDSIIYADGKFVACGLYKIAYSVDGVTWNDVTPPWGSGKRFFSITYGNGRFVVCGGISGFSDAFAGYSDDGINWTQTLTTASTIWCSAAYGNGVFVLVNYFTGPNYSNTAAYSNDGITWTYTTVPDSGGYEKLAYGGGKFVAVDYNSKKVIYSNNGINWTVIQPMPIQSFTSLIYGGDKFVAVGQEGMVYSNDGITWTLKNLDFAANSIAYGNGRFVTTSIGSYISGYSDDLITWEKIPLIGTTSGWAITYGNGRFVATNNYGVSAYLEF